MPIEVGLKMLGDNKILAAKLLRELKRQVKIALNASVPQMRLGIIEAVTSAIKRSPEYRSLVEGGSSKNSISLRGHLGVPDGAAKMEEILMIWANGLRIKIPPITLTSTRLSAKLQVFMIQSNYTDVLASSAAIQVTEKGETLSWLEWLLRFGDKIINKDYEVVIGPGRTGEAVMIKRGRWGIPSEHAGTVNNNFVTRALKDINQPIEDIIASNVLFQFVSLTGE